VHKIHYILKLWQISCFVLFELILNFYYIFTYFINIIFMLSFNRLCLPPYDSYEDMRRMLKIAITEGATGFGLS